MKHLDISSSSPCSEATESQLPTLVQASKADASSIQLSEDGDVSDVPSDDEVIKRLKDLCESRAGRKGDRDTIDSILSTYSALPRTNNMQSFAGEDTVQDDVPMHVHSDTNHTNNDVKNSDSEMEWPPASAPPDLPPSATNMHDTDHSDDEKHEAKVANVLQVLQNLDDLQDQMDDLLAGLSDACSESSTGQPDAHSGFVNNRACFGFEADKLEKYSRGDVFIGRDGSRVAEVIQWRSRVQAANRDVPIPATADLENTRDYDAMADVILVVVMCFMVGLVFFVGA
jgi:hypothetical protein